MILAGTDIGITFLRKVMLTFIIFCWLIYLTYRIHCITEAILLSCKTTKGLVETMQTMARLTDEADANLQAQINRGGVQNN